MSDYPDDETDKYDYSLFSTYPPYIHIQRAPKGVETGLYRLYQDERKEEETEDSRNVRYIKIINTDITDNIPDILDDNIKRLENLDIFIPSEKIKQILMSGEDKIKLSEALGVVPSPLRVASADSGSGHRRKYSRDLSGTGQAAGSGSITPLRGVSVGSGSITPQHKTQFSDDPLGTEHAAGTRQAAGLAARGGAFSHFGSSINLHTIFNVQNKVMFTPRKSERIASSDSNPRTIQIENLPNFNSRIGVGGVAMLFRYFQFLDAVHDLCDSNRGVWGTNVNRISTYRNLGYLYAEDIKWLLNNNYKGKKLYPSFKDSGELDFFLQCICLKIDAIDINSLVFWNYKYTPGVANEFVEPDYEDKYIPDTNAMVVKTTYLLKEYLNIEKRNPNPYIRDKCSNSLYNGLADVIGKTSYVIEAVYKTITSRPEIVYQVDAESNKTKLCGIMQKICDATGNMSTTTVKYSPNAITSEYDAAWAQASNSYINRLSEKPGQTAIVKESSPNELQLAVMCENITLMNILYTKTSKHHLVPVFSALIRCVTGAYYTDILKNEILTKHLIEAIKIFHDGAKTTQAVYYNSLGKVPKNLSETYGFVKNLRKSTPTDKAAIVTDLNQFLVHYSTLDGAISFITLEILNAYSLNAGNFYRIPNSTVPFSDNTPLAGNKNTSLTSSVRAITEGEHYQGSRLISNHKNIQECKGDTLYRCWFKSLGDLGQVLEFHTKTRHKNLSYTFIPIFLTFDRVCAELSIFFNPFTILEEQGQDTGLTFYKKTSRPKFDVLKKVIPAATVGAGTALVAGTGYAYATGTGPFSGGASMAPQDFGKVNKRNIKQKNISKRLKFMSDLDIKNKLKSVGIKITKTIRGKRKYLSRKELENKAILFNKLQNTAKRMKIKIMYKSKSRMYKYKTYKRLQKEINSKYNSNRKYKKTLVKNFNFG